MSETEACPTCETRECLVCSQEDALGEDDPTVQHEPVILE